MSEITIKKCVDNLSEHIKICPAILPRFVPPLHSVTFEFCCACIPLQLVYIACNRTYIQIRKAVISFSRARSSFHLQLNGNMGL